MGLSLWWWFCRWVVSDSATPWTAARRTSLSYTISWSFLKLRSIESVMPSDNLCRPSPPALNLCQHHGLFQWVGSLRWLLFLPSTGSRACGLQVLWHVCSGAESQQLGHMGLVALWHVGSLWTSDGAHISCIGRLILYHWATREPPILHFQQEPRWCWSNWFAVFVLSKQCGNQCILTLLPFLFRLIELYLIVAKMCSIQQPTGGNCSWDKAEKKREPKERVPKEKLP